MLRGAGRVGRSVSGGRASAGDEPAGDTGGHCSAAPRAAFSRIGGPDRSQIATPAHVGDAAPVLLFGVFIIYCGGPSIRKAVPHRRVERSRALKR